MKYALIIDGRVKQIQPYAQAGFVECPDGVFCEFLAVKNDVEWEFTAPPIPPPQPIPRRWSKLKIRRQLRAMGKEQIFDNMLALYNFTSFWIDAEYISEEYPEVQHLLPALPSALGLSQEQIEKILNESII